MAGHDVVYGSQGCITEFDSAKIGLPQLRTCVGGAAQQFQVPPTLRVFET
jgi:hypothetical protein